MSEPTRTTPSLPDTVPASGPPAAATAADASAASWIDHGRFPPGTILGGRYRIVELLGKGGMGEVHRADDLRLGQSIAIKFLPPEFAADPQRMADLRHEVRIARQVTHPNVCRVHDLDEVDGYQFISMEYIDGESLASLLKRIGRLPRDKALEIAHQLCRGLAAAHENGILHRDLKPGNIMIDGRGRVRLTDFGLAGLATQFRGGNARAGTPAYMAPEQMAGKEVSVQSDLYALGLVLYEIFTGKRAFEAQTLAEYERLHREEEPSHPSTYVADLDPAVERVILQCLEKDPRSRPRSALTAMAALPGGDPLAAALAAGETPSPELVAAAGKTGGLSPAIAGGLLAFFLVGLLLIAVLMPKITLVGNVPLDKPAAALVDRAKEMLARFGQTEKPADSDYGFVQQQTYLNHLANTDRSPARWQALAVGQPATIAFWYRQSAIPLMAVNLTCKVTPWDPPANLPGMARIWLDTRGRLIWFEAPPPAYEPLQAASTSQPAFLPPPDWSVLFTAAGLDARAFTPCAPRHVPNIYCDQRAAWQGVYPDAPTIPIQVEAAAYRGKPVYFTILEPWDLDAADTPPPNAVPLGKTLFRYVDLFVALVSLLGGAWLAWRNVQLQRGDRKGSRRLAFYVLGTYLLIWLFGADHVAHSSGEWTLFMIGAGRALLFAAWVWIMYMAAEPYVRRWWPNLMVSWTRLLAGRWRDPLVGRDLLLGAALAVAAQFLLLILYVAPGWLGWPPVQPRYVHLGALRGLSELLSEVLLGQMNACFQPMVALIVLLLLRVVFRNTTVAVAGAAVIFTTLSVLEDYRENDPTFYLVLAVFALLIPGLIFVLFRFGLLTLIAWFFVMQLLRNYPLTLDLSVWYGEGVVLVVLLAAGVAVYGFFTALAGRTLFKI